MSLMSLCPFLFHHLLFLKVCHYGFERGGGVVGLAHGCEVRSFLDNLGSLAGLAGYVAHHGNELVERLDALGLCRLYHERLMEEQREIDGRRVEAMVKQTFGHIECGDASRLVVKTVKHKFMFAHAVDGQEIEVAE